MAPDAGVDPTKPRSERDPPAEAVRYELVLLPWTRTGIGRLQGGCTSFVLQEHWGDRRGTIPHLGVHSATCRPLHHDHHWSCAAELNCVMRFCRPPPKPSDSRNIRLAPVEGIDPSPRGFGDRRAGHSSPVIGSLPRTRTWNVEFNRLAPVPVGTVGNGALHGNRTHLHSLEGWSSPQRRSNANWCRVLESNELPPIFNRPL